MFKINKSNEKSSSEALLKSLKHILSKFINVKLRNSGSKLNTGDLKIQDFNIRILNLKQ
jgi:hypothetical protein